MANKNQEGRHAENAQLAGVKNDENGEVSISAHIGPCSSSSLQLWIHITCNSKLTLKQAALLTPLFSWI